MWPFGWLFDWLRRLLCRLFGLGCPPRCESDPPPEGCAIAWRPSVLVPVFYGVRDVGAAERAPGTARIFFPSLDGSVFGAPILEGCGRYPLILFCHGHCAEAAHHTKWFELPATLARSGYVVVVPALPQVGSGVHPSGADGDLALLGAFEAWARTAWEHRAVLQAGTGLAGHSFGALLAARYALASGALAYGSLSGVWQDWPDSNPPIRSLRIPKFFAWGDPLLDVFTEIGSAAWAALPGDRHRAVFKDTAHWDYLPAGRTTCDRERGACGGVGPASRDLLATFFGKYLPPEGWASLTTCIPDSLVAPPFDRTFEQEFYAGAHLMGLELLAGSPGCGVTLAWDTARGSGSTTKP